MIAPPRTKLPALTIVFPAAAVLLVIASAVSLTNCRQPALRPKLPQPYAPRSGKPPVIFIPGMLGSSLVNRRTGKVVWPELRVDGDEIALPISSPVLAQNTDEVVATEVLEEAKVSALIPEISIYGPLLEDRVRTLADGVKPGEYGRREAFRVHQALKQKGPVTVPREFVFMDRAAIGLGAVFLHLGAEMNFHRLFEEAIGDFSIDRVTARQDEALAATGLEPTG